MKSFLGQNQYSPLATKCHQIFLNYLYLFIFQYPKYHAISFRPHTSTGIKFIKESTKVSSGETRNIAHSARLSGTSQCIVWVLGTNWCTPLQFHKGTRPTIFVAYRSKIEDINIKPSPTNWSSGTRLIDHRKRRLTKCEQIPCNSHESNCLRSKQGKGLKSKKPSPIEPKQRHLSDTV